MVFLLAFFSCSTNPAFLFLPPALRDRKKKKVKGEEEGEGEEERRKK